MRLRIYNTLSGEKEIFRPIRPGRVRIYVCGVTVYDLCHVGHARAGVFFDCAYRYFKYLQKTGELREVTFVRNFTDVDDKIIRKAQEEKKSCREISGKYIEEFYRDMGGLGLLTPDEEPRATDHIPEMIAMIEKLIEKGHAYQSGNNVFFSVQSFPAYGRLSKKRREDLLDGARIEVDEKKKDPADFALWKGSKPGEPQWNSPWGEGRPGWHIECSAMSQKYLGEYFDIHGGGRDLIFPHHENEIAQSQGASDKVPVKYWVHNGFVDINKEKMSKSLGNFFTIREVCKKTSPETLRFFLLSSHYRSGIDFTEQGIKEAGMGVEKFYRALQTITRLKKSMKGREGPPSRDPRLHLIFSTRGKFFEEIEDDFNTAAAIGHLFEWLRAVNALIAEGSPLLPANLDAILRDFRDMAFILGLFERDPDAFFEEENARRMRGSAIGKEEIERLIRERSEARKARDWARSDAIRDGLTKKGIILEDKAEGTVWKFQ